MRFWIYKIQPELEAALTNTETWEMLKTPRPSGLSCAKRNLGFFATAKQLHGVFMFDQKTKRVFVKILRFFSNAIPQRQLPRRGMAILANLLDQLDAGHILPISASDFSHLMLTIKQLNHPSQSPLSLLFMHSDKKQQLSFFVNDDKIPNIHFPLQRDHQSLTRIGKQLLGLKQKLHDADDKTIFRAIFQEIFRSCHTVTSTMFAEYDKWRLFPHRYVHILNAHHGLFPWEMMVFGDKMLAFERNVSRLQSWNGGTFLADQIARKKASISIVFLDAIQSNESYNQYQQLRYIANLAGIKKISYKILTDAMQMVEESQQHNIVHLAAHGQVCQGRIQVALKDHFLPLDPREFLMPLPIVLFADICVDLQQSLSHISLPAHHCLIPDIMVKDGANSAFLQTFYMHLLSNKPVGVAVRLARLAADLAHEDPFAFCYYGNGTLSLKDHNKVSNSYLI